MKISKQIKQERINQGLTQRQLADKMKVKHNQVSTMESGRFNGSTLQKALDSLGLEVKRKQNG